MNENANRRLMEHALAGIEAEIQELQNLRATYIAWLNGEEGFSHLPEHEKPTPPFNESLKLAEMLETPLKVLHCSKCGETGHNKKTCKKKVRRAKL